jgi:hypothetical protein
LTLILALLRRSAESERLTSTLFLELAFAIRFDVTFVALGVAQFTSA